MFNPENQLDYQFMLSHVFSADSPTITGDIALNIETLSVFDYLVPGLDNITGSLIGHLHLEGNWIQPKATGTLTLQNGAADLPLLGIRLEKTKIALQADHSQTLHLTGSTESNHGRLEITGDIQNWIKNPLIQAEIRGQGFQLIHIPAADIDVSPKLTFRKTGRALSLTGTLTIDKARINADLFKDSVQSNLIS